jgi:hypothetical protein
MYVAQSVKKFQLYSRVLFSQEQKKQAIQFIQCIKHKDTFVLLTKNEPIR